MGLRGAIAALAQGGPFTVTRTTEGAFDDAGVYHTAPTPLEVADDIVEAVDTLADTLTLTAHGLFTGDGPFQFTTDDTLPDGILLATDYWVVRVDANKIKLAESLEDAIAASPVIVDLIDEGDGVHTLHDTPDTEHLNSTTSTFSIVASVQPVTGRELKDVPEGQRGDEVRVIYTQTELHMRKAGFQPDVVTLDGEPYEVYKVERFDAFGDTHYRAYAARTKSP